MNFKNYYKHFITIVKHKYYVFQECFKMGIYWQGVIHDISKFSYQEFVNSAKYFQGDSSPIDAEKIKKGYSEAWLHHKGRNKHHWQYWIDYDRNGNEIVCKIPEKYLKEMVADLIGASKAYLKGNFNPSEPIKYFDNNSKNWKMIDSDKEFVRKTLIEILNPLNKFKK